MILQKLDILQVHIKIPEIFIHKKPFILKPRKTINME